MEQKLRQITDLLEIKKIEQDILDYTVSVCEQNNLKYMLAYGTLLGAVRHKGFIPWDDDVDIVMPRDDYDKLKDIWGAKSRYKLLDCRKDKEYIYPFMKIVDTKTKLEEYDVLEKAELGIYIDIFSYDAVPDREYYREKLINKCKTLEKMRVHSMMSMDKILSSDKKKNMGRKLMWYVLRKIGPARLSRKMERVIAGVKSENTKYKGVLCTRFPEREIMPSNVWENTIELEFEGKKYKAPQEYDKILRTNYGDYMQLPPEEKRCLTHNFKAWEYL